MVAVMTAGATGLKLPIFKAKAVSQMKKGPWWSQGTDEGMPTKGICPPNNQSRAAK